MNIHKNARLKPRRREEMARSVVEGRLSKAVAARTYGVTAKVVARWVGRFQAEGRAGMADRSSRPTRSPRQTAATLADEIVTLRRQRLTGKPRPTARPSASSRPRSGNGPTASPTRPQTTAPPNCRPGSTATIGTGLTAA